MIQSLNEEHQSSLNNNSGFLGSDLCGSSAADNDMQEKFKSLMNNLQQEFDTLVKKTNFVNDNSSKGTHTLE